MYEAYKGKSISDIKTLLSGFTKTAGAPTTATQAAALQTDQNALD